MTRVPLLVLGAGPYGLATAALAKRRGIDCVVVGEPMGFWRQNMPEGMLLRSGIDWQLDPLGIHTLRAYLEDMDLDEGETRPLSVELFIAYADWYAAREALEVRRQTATALRAPDESGFVAELEDGSAVVADAVVATPGLRYFACVPPEIAASLAPERYSHTCTTTSFGALEGSRLLILGGRQSAFEWAALATEKVGADVEIVFRHDRPRFEASDWSFIDPLLAQTVHARGWFRRLGRAAQQAIINRFWSEGRLKLEPWLGPRISRPTIRVRPNERVLAYVERPAGDVEVRLGSGRRLVVDHVLLATGYTSDLTRVPYLASSGLAGRVAVRNGFPILDEDFQATAPGLFLPGWPATQDFGPFFGFLVGVPTAATMIVAKLLGSESDDGERSPTFAGKGGAER